MTQIGSAISFRQLTEDDFDLLAVWLGHEHVQEWWRDPSAPTTVREKYGPRVRGEVPTEVFVVHFESVDVGMIQRYRIVDHPEWLEAWHERGLMRRTQLASTTCWAISRPLAGASVPR